jgi:hypothetical protein
MEMDNAFLGSLTDFNPSMKPVIENTRSKRIKVFTRIYKRLFTVSISEREKANMSNWIGLT